MKPETFKELMTYILEDADLSDALILSNMVVPVIDQMRNDELRKATLDFCKKETEKIMARNGWKKL